MAKKSFTFKKGQKYKKGSFDPHIHLKEYQSKASDSTRGKTSGVDSVNIGKHDYRN